MSNESCRVEFEAWMKKNNLELWFDRFDCEEDQERPGEYEVWLVQVAWESWQAAMEHAKKTMCNRN